MEENWYESCKCAKCIDIPRVLLRNVKETIKSEAYESCLNFIENRVCYKVASLTASMAMEYSVLEKFSNNIILVLYRYTWNNGWVCWRDLTTLEFTSIIVLVAT